MDLQQRTVALLALVEQHRQRRCAELLEPAQAEARTAVRAALAEARRRVRTAVAEARALHTEQVAAAEAALATERRLAEQRRAALLLRDAWTGLRARLLQHWSDEPSRAHWVERHVQRALTVVPHGAWRIEHAADWPAAERRALEAQLRAAGVDATFSADATIAAGLRLRGAHNALDATLDGLLAEREALEGRLLQALLEEPST